MATFAVEMDRAAVEKIRESELEEARELQRAMVPEKHLRVALASVASHFRPASAVGGDFLDYFVLPDGSLGIYVGDVVGKGLPAALYAALAIGTLRGIHKNGESPANVLQLMNRRLRLSAMRGRFCVVQYAVFDPATRLLRYANSGLPGPIHITARGCRELRHGGLPVGMFESSCYQQKSLQLAPGDAVLFMTDGLTEVMRHDESQFGIDALREICAQNHRTSPETLLQRIFAAADEFAAGHPQNDDMTAAVLQLDGHGR